MPTITPTRRPGLCAALDRHLTGRLPRPLPIPADRRVAGTAGAWSLLLALGTVLVGLAGAGLTVHLAA